jgi:hypothetical protein
MKKNKLTTAQRKAAAKRGEKRTARLRKTQSEKPLKQAKLAAEKKAKEKKFREAMQKLMESRGAQQPGF